MSSDGSLFLEEKDFADPEALSKRLAQAGLNLDAYEIRLARERFGRPLRWAEIVCLDILWSEHCSYKSTRPLLGRLPTAAPQVILGPGEDAGVVTLGEHEGKRYAAVIGHESHNHPSQVVPYEGAATGVGGIVRDVACMGAHVVGTLDGLRFGTGEKKGGARTREIVREVVAGIADYGNALGVPNLGGDVVFDAGFDANCLVNVVAVGVVETDKVVRSRVPGLGDWAFVLAGKPTDASGFGGASFASTVLSDEESERRGAVQLADPFLLRVLTVANEALLDLARKEGWPIACKDLGAGGIACATVELADAGGVGVDIMLDQAHRAPEPLPPWVLLCSETQERYCWIVPWDVRDQAVAVFNGAYKLADLYPGAGASVIGRSRADGTYRVTWKDEVLVECPASLLTEGIRCPRAAVRRPARETNGHHAKPSLAPKAMPDLVLEALADPGLASRSFLFERYDPDVQGNTVVRRGDADATVLAPVAGARWGLAVALGGNPWHGLADARLAAQHAVCEAARNVIAVGAQPWCLTDCLNFGSALDPLVMGDFEAAIDGLGEAARALGTEGFDAPLPFVSGNVSLYNQDENGNAIPPSPIVACLGRVEDLARVLTPGLKRAKHVLVYVGPPRGDLAGSHYGRRTGLGGIPPLDLTAERARQRAVRSWIARGWVEAAHDVGEGGLVVAALEMAFASADGLGLVIEWPSFAADREHETAAWWSEEPGFLLEVSTKHVPELLRDALTREVGAIPIGQVLGENVLRARRPGHEEWQLDLLAARDSWTSGLAQTWELTEEPIGARS